MRNTMPAPHLTVTPSAPLNKGRFLVAAFVALLLVFQTPAPGSAQMRDTDGAGICPVMLRHFYSVDGTNSYVATLTAADKGDYAGSITLFGETQAYETSFASVRINGRAALSITMPAHVRIDYASMDTAGLRGAAATSCPTFVVVRGGAGADGALAAGHDRATASSRGNMPDLPCGQIWQNAVMRKPPETFMYAPVVKNAKTTIHFFVDSDGHVFDPQLLESSGDSTVDAQAVTSALTAKFQPATFLCSPVISDTTYTFTFEGRDRL